MNFKQFLSNFGLKSYNFLTNNSVFPMGKFQFVLYCPYKPLFEWYLNLYKCF